MFYWGLLSVGFDFEKFLLGLYWWFGSDFQVWSFVFNIVVLCRKKGNRIFFISFYNNSLITCCFYGCEIWSLTLREERRLRVSENSPKGVEVRGEWRKIYNEELNVLYSSTNIVRLIKFRRNLLHGISQ